MSSYNFQKMHPLDRAVKLIRPSEKKEIMDIYYKHTHIHHISVDDPISIQLGAKENDIISIRDHTTDIYRLVVKREKII